MPDSGPWPGNSRLRSLKSLRAASTAGGMDDTVEGCTSWTSLPPLLLPVIWSPAVITLPIWQSSGPGFLPMRRAWIIWTGSGGLMGSVVRVVEVAVPAAAWVVTVAQAVTETRLGDCGNSAG